MDGLKQVLYRTLGIKSLSSLVGHNYEVMVVSRNQSTP